MKKALLIKKACVLIFSLHYPNMSLNITFNFDVSSRKTCGGGTQVWTKTYTNPFFAHGGADCLGSDAESQNCNGDAWGRLKDLKYSRPLSMQ